MTDNKFYNKNLKNFTRENRKQMTQAEVFIWENILRKKQLYGLKFLRQRPVDKYIADFMCKEINLIIEIDGLTHSFEYIYISK
ncbi:MAG: endonuclease domain-containing protein [Chitinophagales bacterium]